MLLRSCSTPVLGSLVSSISESPNHCETNHHSHTNNKLSFPQTGSTNLTTVYRSSSPISPSINGDKGFRRAQSEGNLEGLAYAHCGNNFDDQPKMFPKRPKCSILQTIPSFSFCNSKFGSEDDESEEEGEEFLERKVAMGVGDVGLEGKMKKMGVTEEVGVKNVDERNEDKNRRMKLLKGLGIGGSRGGGGGSGGGKGGGGGGFNWWGGSGGDDGDKQRMEEYFKDLVEAYPGNALFLRNYAEFLYESKGDLGKAEEYYFRAILADPKDGEILLEYAKVVWELHHDKDKAAIYFGKAVQVSPKDCNIQAAYANFLWETEVAEEEDQPGVGMAKDLLPPLLNGGTIY